VLEPFEILKTNKVKIVCRPFKPYVGAKINQNM